MGLAYSSLKQASLPGQRLRLGPGGESTESWSLDKGSNGPWLFWLLRIPTKIANSEASEVFIRSERVQYMETYRQTQRKSP